MARRELVQRQRDQEQERSERLEEQLAQTQRMEAIGRLAGGVAHDFNNLLGVILSNSELLLQDKSLDKRLSERIQEIKMAGEEAASVTRQLLACSRQQVFERQILDLNVVLGDMQPLLARIIRESIHFEMELGKRVGAIRMDRSQLAQVILNLVANARDAMTSGGRLKIETSKVELGESYADEHVDVRPGSYVQLSVTDSGSGMDKQTVSRIFEPFFTTKEQGRGSGLGLATVYGIFRQSGRTRLGLQRARIRHHSQGLFSASHRSVGFSAPQRASRRGIRGLGNHSARGRLRASCESYARFLGERRV